MQEQSYYYIILILKLTYLSFKLITPTMGIAGQPLDLLVEIVRKKFVNNK
jgi:hypothetical protein